MKITPLAIYTKDDENIEENFNILRQEARITHPNNLTHEISFIYCRSIKFLIDN